MATNYEAELYIAIQVSGHAVLNVCLSSAKKAEHIPNSTPGCSVEVEMLQEAGRQGSGTQNDGYVGVSYSRKILLPCRRNSS